MINTKGVKPAKFESVEDAPAWCALACAYVVAGHSAPEKAADAMLAEFRTRAGRAPQEDEAPESSPASEPEAKTDEKPADPAPPADV